MKNTTLFTGVIVTSAVLIITYRVMSSFETDYVQADTATQLVSHSDPVISGKNVPDKIHAQTHVEVVKRIDEKLSDNFQLIAAAYAEEIKFPPYSQPLTRADKLLLQPNFYHAQSVPLENGGSAIIKLDKFRFTYPEPINVYLQLKAITAYDVSLHLYDESTNKLLASSKMHTSSEGYYVNLDPDAEWDGSLRVEVEFKSGGQFQIVQTGFEYIQPVAQITGVGETSTEGVDLIIPMKIKVNDAGHYRLRANLFTAAHEPLALLSSSDKLSSGETEIKLRIHKSILEGNPEVNSDVLWLTTFQLEKRSAAPGVPTRYGDSAQPGYTVKYTSTNLFSNEKYKPSEAEIQRLTFLEQMAEKNK